MEPERRVVTEGEEDQRLRVCKRNGFVLLPSEVRPLSSKRQSIDTGKYR
ncbi:hypothetical protein STRTUCAR8_09530 [Streptomyces turgidiscabies Car8]|uniref:Uncharacterized protein n=1 Tax=Streptomyces turgidiscabies (strain Car8) TaxID=698760 RepID=L7F691_STRT8|nr:hypothetical protein STRTUCAR8_09530 [Streptomyces turgidiscabies Car8]